MSSVPGSQTHSPSLAEGAASPWRARAFSRKGATPETPRAARISDCRVSEIVRGILSRSEQLLGRFTVGRLAWPSAAREAQSALGARASQDTVGGA